MKKSKLYTLWIIMLSCLHTAKICMLSIFKQITGKTNRAWVDTTIQCWTNRLLNLIGVKCIVYNPFHTKPEPGQATIVMCNHTSLYDIPISFKAFPHHSLRMLAKKELSKIPIMGKGMAAAEFPFIDRKNRQQAIKDLAFTRQLMESGIIIWIAPEGTRSQDGKLGSFKKGAFITAIEAKATIIPIGIRGAYDILPARTFQLNMNKTAEIHIGKPIDASQYSINNKEELIKTVFQTMQALVGENPG